MTARRALAAGLALAAAAAASPAFSQAIRAVGLVVFVERVFL